MYLQEVKQVFIKTVEGAQIDRALKDSLIRHERMDTFQRNIAQRLIELQNVRTKQMKPLATLEQRGWLAEWMTNVFIETVKKEGEEKIESSYAKHIREKELRDQRDMEETAKGNISGDYCDIIKEIEEFDPETNVRTSLTSEYQENN